MSWFSNTLLGKGLSAVGTGIKNAASWVGKKASQFGNWLVDDAIPSAANYISDLSWDMSARQRQYDEAQRELEYQRSLPSTQVQNLKDAGLNEAMFYNSGSSAAAGNYTPNTAESSVNSAFDALRAVGSSATGLLDMLGQYQSVRNGIANVSKLKEHARSMKLNNDLQEAENKYLGIYNEDGTVRDPNWDAPTVNADGSISMPFKHLFQEYFDTKYRTFSHKSAYWEWKAREQKGLAGGYREYKPWYAVRNDMWESQADYYRRQGSYIDTMNDRLIHRFSPKFETLLEAGLHLTDDIVNIATKGLAGRRRGYQQGYFPNVSHY